MTTARKKLSTLLVMAPDKASGNAFGSVLEKSGITIRYHYPVIAPRVLGEEINPSILVTLDLAQAIKDVYTLGYTNIVIACNTLQLWLPKAGLHLGAVKNRVRILSTIEAVKLLYPDPVGRPLWLGTTVMVRNLSPDDYPTLITKHQEELQHICQEIVWRVKAVSGDDSTTAFKMKNINSPEILTARTNELINKLTAAGISQVVLGCTELPIAFDKYADPKRKKQLAMILDPAVAVARQYVQEADKPLA